MRTIHVSPVVRRATLRRLTAASLATTAMIGVATSVAGISLLASAPALASGFGGAGGAGDVSTVTAGDGGSGGTNGSGSDGNAGGGASVGGTGGTSPGANGADGTSDGAGGGGGGGGASGASTNFTILNNTGTVTGNAGGAGGNGASNGGGGGGGGGGGDIVVTGTGAMTNSGTITGGAGGNGGSGDTGNGGANGDGGGGGAGLIFTMGGVTFTNTSSGTVAGGANGGSSGGQGNGIMAVADLTVINAGTITGSTGISASTSDPLVVTNTATGRIEASQYGIASGSGAVTVVNSGAIISSGYTAFAISFSSSLNLTNNAGDGVNTGIIQGQNGIYSYSPLNITNSGAIVGTSQYGIFSFGAITLTNNGGTITGGDTGIRAWAAVDINNTGTISGGQYGVVTAGDSNLFNAGTISGSVAAIQFSGSSNTLTLGAGSVINGVVLGTGSDTFQLGGSKAASFDISALGDTAQYQGFSAFNKVDSSVWTLTGTSAFTGDLNVNGGTLVANGNLSSMGTAVVNSGGTLSGTGIVPFTLVSDGATLAPGPTGSATGTLTINDRVMFCACSTYAVKVSATSSDLAGVVAGGFGPGDAFLGGLVRVTSPTSSYRFNSAYTILTTQGGLNGTTFDSLITPSAIGGALSYTSNDVLLTLTSQLGKTAGLNASQQRLATTLDNAFNSFGSTAGLGGLFAGNIAQGLTQISGETATGAQQTTFDAVTKFMSVMTDPFTAGRGFDPAPVAGYADTQNPRDAYAMFTKTPLAKSYDPRWSVWASGFGGSQTTNGNTTLGSNNTTSSIGGIAVGADYWLSPNTIAGFSLAGSGANFSVANGGSGHSDMFQAGAFIKHSQASAYVTAALAYGWQDVTTDRLVTLGGINVVHAEFNANSFSGRVEGGNRYLTAWFGGLGVTPYLAAQVVALDLPAYAERNAGGAGAFALNYAGKTVTSTRSELGFRTDKSFAVADAILTLRGRAAWAHDYNTDRSVAATFQALPGASFTVAGAAPARDAALTTASAEMSFISGISLAATFEGEFSDVTRSYAGKGTVRYVW